MRYACATPEVARQLAARRRADLQSFGDARELARYDVGTDGCTVIERYARTPAKNDPVCMLSGDSARRGVGGLFQPQPITEVWGDEHLKGECRVSQNGVYDVYLVTRVEQPGEGVKPLASGKVGFIQPKAEHGWIASPEHAYRPLETLAFRVPRLDAGRAGLLWLEALGGK